jgi:hypothetical protein
MKRLLALTLLLLPLVAALGQDAPAAPAAVPATRPASDDIVYEDPTAQSTATITQVFSSTSNATTNTTLANVRRIRIKSDILIIEWGDTATTLLPKQFVTSIALNRRATGSPRSP